MDIQAAKPVVAAREPKPVEVEEGKTYFWCACGRSKNQPLCDGSHKDTAFTPLAYKAEKSGTLFFCQCKQTGRAPLCDGSHSRL